MGGTPALVPAFRSFADLHGCGSHLQRACIGLASEAHRLASSPLRGRKCGRTRDL